PSKDLIVQPNPPRFLSEGDSVEFTVKVSNQSSNIQTGSVQLTFTDALTGQSADKVIDLRAATSFGVRPSGAHSSLHPDTLSTTQTFEIPPKQSRTFSWSLTI